MHFYWATLYVILQLYILKESKKASVGILCCQLKIVSPILDFGYDDFMNQDMQEHVIYRSERCKSLFLCAKSPLEIAMVNS